MLTKYDRGEGFERLPMVIGEKKKWKVNPRSVLGKGSYGVLCIAKAPDSPYVAVKFEELPKTTNKKRPVLYYDQQFLYYFNLSKNTRVPEIFEYGSKDGFYFLVMSLHGPNINDCLKKAPTYYTEDNKYKSRLSLKTKLLMCLGMFDCVKAIHDNGIVHRDLKPDNFVIGKYQNPSSGSSYGENEGRYSNENLAEWKKIYILDFGLSKQYINQDIHIPLRHGKDLTGTARYVSINTHKGHEQSRRDDCESLGHVILFILKNGKLPWIGLNCPDRTQQFKKIAEIKENTDLNELCGEFPEMAKYLLYIRRVVFQMEPNYAFMRERLTATAEANNIDLNENCPQYDWDLDYKYYESLAPEFKRINYPPPSNNYPY